MFDLWNIVNCDIQSDESAEWSQFYLLQEH